MVDSMGARPSSIAFLGMIEWQHLSIEVTKSAISSTGHRELTTDYRERRRRDERHRALDSVLVRKLDG